MGYAFVDLSTPTEAERAIAELSGKDILERKVSVQLARTPQPAGEKAEGGANGDSGAEGSRRRASGRGRGRGRGRAGRAGRGGRSVRISLAGETPSIPSSTTVQILTFSQEGNEPNSEGAADNAGAPDSTEVLPLTDITNKTNTDNVDKKKENRPARERRERGPPADGIPSKNKVMVANLPYDLTEEKVLESPRCIMEPRI